MEKWLLQIQEYVPEQVKHILGEDNNLPDCISRNPLFYFKFYEISEGKKFESRLYTSTSRTDAELLRDECAQKLRRDGRDGQATGNAIQNH